MPFEQSFQQFSDKIQALEATAPSAWAAQREELRQASWQVLQSQGFPTRRDEDWKYTPVKPLLEGAWRLAEVPTQSLTTAPAIAESFLMALCDGFFLPPSGAGELPEGVSIRPLKDTPRALDFHSEAFYREIKRDAFFHLNESFSYDGVVIEIAEGVVLERPLEILHHTSAQCFAASRVLIKLGRRAQAQVLQRFVSPGVNRTAEPSDAQPSLSNTVTEVFLEQDAHLGLYQLNQENLKSFHLNHVNIVQNRHSCSQVVNVSLGAKLARHAMNVRQLGEGAESGLHGLYTGLHGQHVDYCTVIDHAVSHGQSSQLCKGLLARQSRAVFNGVIKIRPQAQQINSEQLNKNLILDQSCEVDTRPQLQIDADDVKAAHGATIGQLDPEEIFYLQSRAIERPQAVQMLARGFVEDVLYKIDSLAIRQYLQTQVAQSLSDLPLPEMSLSPSVSEPVSEKSESR